MSYYDNRIKALEAKVAEMSRMQRMKAIPVEAKLVERVAEYQAENTRLKAEVERLRASSFVTAVPVEEYEKLKAEVENLNRMNRELFSLSKGQAREINRLRKFNDEALAHIAKEERKSRECLDMAQAEVERLRKAGDAMADAAYAHCMCQDCEELRDQWRDAKRGDQP